MTLLKNLNLRLGKAIKLLLCLSASIFLLSCKKQEDHPVIFSVLKDGTEWLPTNKSVIYSVNSKEFHIQAEKKFPQYTELLLIDIKIGDLSSPVIFNQFSAGWIELISGQGLTNTFHITTDPINIIHITSIDSISKEITGTFSIKLSRDKIFQQPDTIHLTEGIFSLPYYDVSIP
jgi:hypothetical protein